MQEGAILVTGGSGGLGSGICRRLVDDWSSLVFTYFGSVGKAEELKRDLALPSIEAMRMDIRNDAEVSAALERADALAGGLKGVVFTAGADILQPFVSQMTQEMWENSIEIELLGFARLIRLSLPILRRRDGGAIVSVVSVANYWFPPGDAISGVPKAGIEMLTRAVAKEEGRYGIRANSVAPGIINAGLGSLVQQKTHSRDVWEQQKRRVPLRRFGEAGDVAEAVGFLASSRSSYITGQTIIVDGGLSL